MSFRKSVSLPHGGQRHGDPDKVVPRAIQAFGATGMVTTLLRTTMAMKPGTNQGMDGAASHSEGEGRNLNVLPR